MSERIGMLESDAMSVSEALCLAEAMVLDAKLSTRRLFGRDLALAVLAQRVRELNVPGMCEEK